MFKFTKRKKLIIVSLAVIVLMIAGITMAYLTAFTPAKTNTFTVVGSNIAITLQEPAWDADGHTKATNFVPGRVIPKNPSVTNTSTAEIPIWVAIKLDYTVPAAGGFAANTYDSLNTFAIINWLPGWDANATHTRFYYQTTLNKDATTNELFNKITIRDTVGYTDLYPFDVRIKAYAVQAEGLDFAAAQAQLDILMNNNP